VGVGHGEQRAQVGLGLLDGRVELLPAVAHLHDAHPGAAVVDELLLRLLEHGERQRGRARREVVDAPVPGARAGGCRGWRRHRRAADPGGAGGEADGRCGGGRGRALEEERVRRGGGGGHGGNQEMRQRRVFGARKRNRMGTEIYMRGAVRIAEVGGSVPVE
jgi:hypothetical protein